jgi:hypothetical protein
MIFYFVFEKENSRHSGLAPVTSRTKRENHTTRPASHSCRISKGEVSFTEFVRMRETYAWEIIFDVRF